MIIPRYKDALSEVVKHGVPVRGGSPVPFFACRMNWQRFQMSFRDKKIARKAQKMIRAK